MRQKARGPRTSIHPCLLSDAVHPGRSHLPGATVRCLVLHSRAVKHLCHVEPAIAFGMLGTFMMDRPYVYEEALYDYVWTVSITAPAHPRLPCCRLTVTASASQHLRCACNRRFSGTALSYDLILLLAFPVISPNRCFLVERSRSSRFSGHRPPSVPLMVPCCHFEPLTRSVGWKRYLRGCERTAAPSQPIYVVGCNKCVGRIWRRSII